MSDQIKKVKTVRTGRVSATERYETETAIDAAFDAGRKAAAKGFIGICYNQYTGAYCPELEAAWNEGNKLCA